jgi:putative CocE/NonD family hydrolase
MMWVLAGLLLLGSRSAVPAADSLYRYTTSREFLRMKDGTRLAVTWWKPVPKRPGERFPALLELLPYRKDDSFYARDYPVYDYFVRRGFLMAKVDIRGTGGSDGPLPPREYSEQELDDAVEIIAQLARHPSSNGNVGMWGISWGGFNSIQTAMRQPPALKAILALHATDDLFHDDVRYIDGGLHIDPYTLEIDHENALPRTPDYRIDRAYFRDRFDAYPWVLTYLKQPADGPFWRRNGLRFRPDALQVPAYLIGGLLDGYRDMPLRALEYLEGPVKVEIGPWNHSWPDDGAPGPNYEWRSRVVRWWNHWLRGADSGLLEEPRLLVFQRDGHPPDRNLAQTPGNWRFEDWPVRGGTRDTLMLGSDNRLVPLHSLHWGGPPCPPSVPTRDSLARSPAPCQVTLGYLPGFGTAAGDWWGEPTGDMRRDDAGSLVFDGAPLDDTKAILGFPRVRLRVAAGAALANWSVRLEDVAPDGAVSLVADAALNGTHHRSTAEPARMEPDRVYDLSLDLHFTTWTFRPGHRVRLAVSNAQFPMIWPTPYPMVSRVLLGSLASSVELPLVPNASAYPSPRLPVPEPRRERPDVSDLPSPGAMERISYDQLAGSTVMEFGNSAAWTIGSVRYDYAEHQTYRTSDRDPSRSGFLGVEYHRIRPPGRDLRLETTIDIRSDSTSLQVTVTRVLQAGVKVIRRKVWREAVPRDWH